MDEDSERRQTPDEEPLDVTAEEEELPPVEEVAADEEEDILVIEAEDLIDVPVTPEKRAAGPGAYPPVGDISQKPQWPAVKKGLVAPSAVAVISMTVAGSVGGFVAWLLSEPFITDAPHPPQLLVYVLAAMGLFGACVGGIIGMALGCVEGINSRVWEKAGRGAVLGLAVGAAGGFVGGVFGQVVYGALVPPTPTNPLQLDAAHILVRSLGWGVVGLFVGLGQGMMSRSRRKMVNGMIGGTVGGLIGGMLFEPIPIIIAHTVLRLTGGTIGGEVSRLVALTIMGMSCGAAISVVEQMRKEAWLRIVAGPLAGKEFIIYRSPTVIGSSPKCDITLALDKRVAPQHASIALEGNHYVLTDLGTGGGTMVNGRMVRSRVLRGGDRITIGETTLQYADRVIHENA